MNIHPVCFVSDLVYASRCEYEMNVEKLVTTTIQ